MTEPLKTAIVTGASRGIGAAIARHLASDGFAIVMTYAARTDDAEAVVASIVAAGGQATAVQADVRSTADVARLFDKAEADHGGVDVVVNNAGIMTLSPIAETGEADFDDHIAVNLTGTFNMLREAAARVRDSGRIVNVSTSALGLSRPGYAAYNASKAGVEALTRVLANEMRGRSVTVNAVAPGPVGTELLYQSRPQEVIDALAAMAPLERLGTPDEVASVVSFLVGPAGGWINGQIVRANGGLV